MSQVMVITVTKADDGSVSATVDSPEISIGAAPADIVAGKVARIITHNLQ
jgi:hypothetical protein